MAVRILLVLVLLLPSVASAQTPPDALWNRSLEELMQIEIVSVGKKEQKVFDSAASVYVLTRDEIRRSGLSTVPDLLRLVPGVMVSRIDQSKWAVSIRGFNSRFANKLLVMIDGRSLYNRMFAGVFWDALAVPVAEIERIEVIRGPGASVWGTNAVNGVVNIVTRSASADPGTSVEVRSGVGERAALDVAHGISRTNGGFRLFARAADTEGEGFDDYDSWREAIVGLRAERGRQGRPRFRFQANAGHSDAGQRSLRFVALSTPAVVPDDVRATTDSFNAVATVTLPRSAREEWEIVATADRIERHEPDFYRYTRSNFDLNLQHRSRRLARQEIVWGTGVRSSRDVPVSEGPTLGTASPRWKETLFNAFVQDEIKVADPLRVTLGSKVEYSSVISWNWQPSVRAWWSPERHTAVWGAFSHALRTPSWTDRDVRFHAGADTTSGPLPLLFAWIGNPAVRNEKMDGYEAGVRTSFFDRVAFDVSGYYNRYGDVMVTPNAPPTFELFPFEPHLLIAMRPQNALDLATAGVETVATVELSARWSLIGTVESFRVVDWRSPLAEVDPSIADGNAPAYQWSLRSNLKLGGNEYNAELFRAGALPSPVVPGYYRLDAQVTRPIGRGLELSVIGQNLLGAHRRELMAADLVEVATVGRTVVVRAGWHFGR